MSIDYSKLRDDLTDYYGTAAFSGMPAALIDVVDIQSASNDSLLRRASENGFDLSDYSCNNGWW
ncbi:MAG: hypothetical protein J5852_05400 [Clostridia bacterium]|nr:hypothetical protein [Clostridia bacterium]